jgi:hypothetical protein
MLFSLPLFAVTPIKNPQVTLEWDSPADTDIVKYIVYWGNASGDYLTTVEVTPPTLPGVPATTTLIKDLTPNTTYYFIVTAVNSAGLESLPSNEISWTSPKRPGAPRNLRIKLVKNEQGQLRMQLEVETAPMATVSIEASPDLNSWERIGEAVSNEEGIASFIDEDSDKFSQRFYRAGI